MLSSTALISDSELSALRGRILPYLEQKRVRHVLGVEKEAVELGALLLPEDDSAVKSAYISQLRAAALLHDITKKDNCEKQLKYCRDFGIICDGYLAASPKRFHAMTAAEIIKCDFPDYASALIVNAVRWHTTGRENMTLTETIIYLADYIEPTREFGDCVKLRSDFYGSVAKNSDDLFAVLRKIMVESFDMTIKILLDEGAPVGVDAVSARNYFLVSNNPFDKIFDAGT